MASSISGIHRRPSHGAGDILSVESSLLSEDDVLRETVGPMCMCIGQLSANVYHGVAAMTLEGASETTEVTRKIQNYYIAAAAAALAAWRENKYAVTWAVKRLRLRRQWQ